MEKAYNRINWKDDPDRTTPLSAENLNKMDKAINDIDNRVVEIDERMTETDEELAKSNSVVKLGLIAAKILDDDFAADETCFLKSSYTYKLTNKGSAEGKYFRKSTDGATTASGTLKPGVSATFSKITKDYELSMNAKFHVTIIDGPILGDDALYKKASDNGYTGTKAEFYEDLSALKNMSSWFSQI